MDGNGGFSPGWALAIQGAIYVLTTVVSIWRTNKKTAEKAAQVIACTPSHGEMEAKLEASSNEIHSHLAALGRQVEANAKAVPVLIQKSLEEFGQVVQDQITQAMQGVAANVGPRVATTVLKGDKKDGKH